MRPAVGAGSRVRLLEWEQPCSASISRRLCWAGGMPARRIAAGAVALPEHDLRTPLPETGFDVACNIFSSFGYGTEEEDVAIFRTLRDAVRPGGRVLVETNHRDLTCTVIARGSKASKRLADGTLFLDEPDFDPISGVARRVYVPPR